MDLIRRRGRRLSRDRLGRIARLTRGRSRGLFLPADALLEGLETLAEVAKQLQHNGQHDHPVPDAEATHVKKLPEWFVIARERLSHPRGRPGNKSNKAVLRPQRPPAEAPSQASQLPCCSTASGSTASSSV